MTPRRPEKTEISRLAGRAARLGGLCLVVMLGGIASLSVAAKPQPQAPEPPALPAASDAVGLYQGMGPEVRAQVDSGQRVITFAEQRLETGEHVEMVAVSIGMLRLPPATIRSVLEKISGYPAWLMLQPSYKRARIEGTARLVVDVGSADSPKAKRSMAYDVTTSDSTTTWRVVESGTALKAGSSVSFEVIAHPSLEGASLVIHRQFGLLPAAGRMTNYLSDDDDKGQNHWWKDASRHARRIHWAFDAAVRAPPGKDRSALYVEHYQREFGGKIPYWAEGR